MQADLFARLTVLDELDERVGHLLEQNGLLVEPHEEALHQLRRDE